MRQENEQASASVLARRQEEKAGKDRQATRTTTRQGRTFRMQPRCENTKGRSVLGSEFRTLSLVAFFVGNRTARVFPKRRATWQFLRLSGSPSVRVCWHTHGKAPIAEVSMQKNRLGGLRHTHAEKLVRSNHAGRLSRSGR